MFCDLRGFSQRLENEAGDLIGLLERVSRALGVMTHHILENSGVTGDFQGDATLGFWGWPFPSPDAAVNACRAALGIRAAFAKAAATKNHPLADFEMGIGIAHGRAVAGKIGTAEQVKVTVFGPEHRSASVESKRRSDPSIGPGYALWNGNAGDGQRITSTRQRLAGTDRRPYSKLRIGSGMFHLGPLGRSLQTLAFDASQ